MQQEIMDGDNEVDGEEIRRTVRAELHGIFVKLASMFTEEFVPRGPALTSENIDRLMKEADCAAAGDVELGVSGYDKFGYFEIPVHRDAAGNEYVKCEEDYFDFKKLEKKE